MPDNERDQIIEQVAHVLIDVDWQNVASDAYDMARALDREGLLRTGDDTGEVAKLRAERDRLQQWKDEAAPVLIGLQDLGKALGVPLGKRITGELAAEQARTLKAARDRAVAETAALRNAVRALHQPHVCTGYPDCNPLFGGGCAHAGDCRECRREHPCPTIRALDGGQR